MTDLNQQKSPAKREHYQEIGAAYAEFWKSHETNVFGVPTAETEIAGLRIRVAAEVGMSFDGDDYALEPYFRARKPTRLYRQAVQYLTDQARQGVWSPDWHAAIYDARRKSILPQVRVRAQDLRIGLEGAAADFQQQWRSLDKQNLDGLEL